MTRMHNPPHPGSVLAEWLDGLDSMTISAFARHIGVTRATLSRPPVTSTSKVGCKAREYTPERWP